MLQKKSDPYKMANKKKEEDFDMEDIYDSLAYGYHVHGEKKGEEALNAYLDVWYKKHEDEKLIDAIKQMKKGGTFGNMDYQVTQPAFRLGCEKKNSLQRHERNM